MSAFGGIWNCDAKPLDPNRLVLLSCALTSFGPDTSGCYTGDSIGMVFRSACVLAEDRYDAQPIHTKTGNVMTWDGRLDNRTELIDALGEPLSPDVSDARIVAAAVEHWGTDAFRRLLGDWCLAYWNAASAELMLATDYAGNRRCHYCKVGNEVIWASALGPIVTLLDGALHLSDEFVAAYTYKATPENMTPYKEVQRVDAGTFVRIGAAGSRVCKYWNWENIQPVRYRAQGEYDEHFRHLLRTAVRRRLRTFRPALAELSGGVDSSSVVCLAHSLLLDGAAAAPMLSTVSYFDDRDVAADERPYFGIVESRIGRTGRHINLADHDGCSAGFSAAEQPFPGLSQARYSLLRELKGYHQQINAGVVLSGSGGDELLGGLIDPISHIVDGLRHAPRNAVSLLEAWSLAEKNTRLSLSRGVLSELLLRTHRLRSTTERLPAAPWLRPDLQRLGMAYSTAEHMLPRRSSQTTSGMNYLLYGLACVIRRSWNKLYPISSEVRQAYPYLDRDLVGFVLSVPISELYGPGERRKLVRRALTGLVPHDILWRRNKGYSTYFYLAQLRKYRNDVKRRGFTSPYFTAGYADAKVFAAHLASATHGIQDQVPLLLTSQALELWLTENRTVLV